MESNSWGFKLTRIGLRQFSSGITVTEESEAITAIYDNYELNSFKFVKMSAYLCIN